MKIKFTVLFILGLLLITGGILGKYFAPVSLVNIYNNKLYYSNSKNDSDNESNKQKIKLDELKKSVNKYISQYGEDLEISDIFTFKDSDYYFSIIEKNSGRGAMELLVNPYNERIYPEYGPNMMWNEKYGHHRNGYSGMGMMGGRGRYYSYNTDNYIDKKQANKIAGEYVEKNINKNYKVPDDGHEFYGYYTFHIKEKNKVVGMISVNSSTGEVWYHNWHGKVEQVLDMHDEDSK